MLPALRSALLGFAASRFFTQAAGTCAHDAVPGALLKFKGIAGRSYVTPEKLANKVVLVVNTASFCGYTPQLTSLQQLHERFSPRGLVVLGIPCNDFGAQEPDEEGVILRRYSDAPFNVTFPLTAKYSVSGGEAHPFYIHLQHSLGDAGAPHWNFQKYLVGRDGKIAALFDPSMDPLDKEVIHAVEESLSAPHAGKGEEL